MRATAQAGQFEFVGSGRTFASRAHAERYLLYRAARFAQKRGSNSFRLLYFPGEGPGAYPNDSKSLSRHSTGWEPHWSYRLSTVEGWRRWHPESGERFWAEGVDSKTIREFQVRAMVELGRAVEPAVGFDTLSVIAQLRPLYRRSRP